MAVGEECNSAWRNSNNNDDDDDGGNAERRRNQRLATNTFTRWLFGKKKRRNLISCTEKDRIYHGNTNNKAVCMKTYFRSQNTKTGHQTLPTNNKQPQKGLVAQFHEVWSCRERKHKLRDSALLTTASSNSIGKATVAVVVAVVGVGGVAARTFLFFIFLPKKKTKSEIDKMRDMEEGVMPLKEEMVSPRSGKRSKAARASKKKDKKRNSVGANSHDGDADHVIEAHLEAHLEADLEGDLEADDRSQGRGRGRNRDRGSQFGSNRSKSASALAALPSRLASKLNRRESTRSAHKMHLLQKEYNYSSDASSASPKRRGRRPSQRPLYDNDNDNDNDTVVSSMTMESSLFGGNRGKDGSGGGTGRRRSRSASARKRVSNLLTWPLKRSKSKTRKSRTSIAAYDMDMDIDSDMDINSDEDNNDNDNVDNHVDNHVDDVDDDDMSQFTTQTAQTDVRRQGRSRSTHMRFGLRGSGHRRRNLRADAPRDQDNDDGDDDDDDDDSVGGRSTSTAPMSIIRTNRKERKQSKSPLPGRKDKKSDRKTKPKDKERKKRTKGSTKSKHKRSSMQADSDSETAEVSTGGKKKKRDSTIDGTGSTKSGSKKKDKKSKKKNSKTKKSTGKKASSDNDNGNDHGHDHGHESDNSGDGSRSRYLMSPKAEGAKSVVSVDTTATPTSIDSADNIVATQTQSQSQSQAQTLGATDAGDGSEDIAPSALTPDEASPECNSDDDSDDDAAFQKPPTSAMEVMKAERDVSNAREQCLAVWETELNQREEKIKGAEAQSKQAMQELDTYFCAIRASRMAITQYGANASLQQRQDAVETIEKALSQERNLLRQQRIHFQSEQDGIYIKHQKQLEKNKLLEEELHQLQQEYETMQCRVSMLEMEQHEHEIERDNSNHNKHDGDDDKGFLKGEYAILKQNYEVAQSTIEEQDDEIQRLKAYIQRIENPALAIQAAPSLSSAITSSSAAAATTALTTYPSASPSHVSGTGNASTAITTTTADGNSNGFPSHYKQEIQQLKEERDETERQHQKEIDQLIEELDEKNLFIESLRKEIGKSKSLDRGSTHGGSTHNSAHGPRSLGGFFSQLTPVGFRATVGGRSRSDDDDDDSDDRSTRSSAKHPITSAIAPLDLMD